MIQNLINHIAFVVDKSSSMDFLSRKVVEVFDRELERLKGKSVELNQETRISIYLFNENVECLVFDMDVMRMTSLSGYYRSYGATALIDATLKGITDMQKLPELYGDHAFLVYAITDGEENRSINPISALSKKIEVLPDNWTLVCMVPNERGVLYAEKYGFLRNNIQIWDVSTKGMEKVGTVMSSAMDTYMTNRSQGLRSSKAFFSDLTDVKVADVKGVLQEVRTMDYEIHSVQKDSIIKPFVLENSHVPFVKGCAFYELTKPETVQEYKQIAIQNKKNRKVYGGKTARQMLGLPDAQIKLKPGEHGDWKIYVQSTSVNRKLLAGTSLLVMTKQ
jgi:hypothetical protein